MRKYDAPQVICPFDKSHFMPLQRLQFHQPKCELQFIKNNPGAIVFHCKHHFQHVFFDVDSLKKHETEECQSRPETIRARAKKQEQEHIQDREHRWRDSDEEKKLPLKQREQIKVRDVKRTSATKEFTLGISSPLMIEAKLAKNSTEKNQILGKRYQVMDPRLTLTNPHDATKRMKLQNLTAKTSSSATSKSQLLSKSGQSGILNLKKENLSPQIGQLDVKNSLKLSVMQLDLGRSPFINVPSDSNSSYNNSAIFSPIQ
eukprot:403365046